MWGTYTVAVMRHQPSKAQHERWADQGDLIRRVRERKELSQAELGRELNLSPKTVIQIEKGRRQLNQQEMDVLIRVLGIRTRAFFDPPRRSQTLAAPLDDYLDNPLIEQAMAEVAVAEVSAEADLARRRSEDSRQRRSSDHGPAGVERRGSREESPG